MYSLIHNFSGFLVVKLPLLTKASSFILHPFSLSPSLSFIISVNPSRTASESFPNCKESFLPRKKKPQLKFQPLETGLSLYLNIQKRLGFRVCNHSKPLYLYPSPNTSMPSLPRTMIEI